MQLRKMRNWKAPGLDGIQGFRLKWFTSQHQRLTVKFNENIQSLVIPSWLLKSRTILIQKDYAADNAVGSYQPIACLNLLWKLKTGIIADKLYQHLENKNLLLEEQKGCRHACRGTKDQLLIDKAVIRNCKRRKTNLNMAWVDFRKTYDMVPHVWIIKALKLIGAASNVIALLKSTMTDWNTELITKDINLGEVNINQDIFLGDSLSPLLFVMSLIPLTLALRQMKQGYSFQKGKSKLNHLLFMDNLKLYGSNQNGIDSLVRTVEIVAKDIGMKFVAERVVF